MKVCGVCETIFREYAIFIDGHCPMRNCCGQVLDIDDNLFETYRLLNSKGYWTISCCSGHSYEAEFEEFRYNDVQTYISFGDEFHFKMIPKGFILSRDTWIDVGGNESPSTTIRKKYDRNLSTVALQIEIWKTAQDILEWAEKLECHEENDD